MKYVQGTRWIGGAAFAVLMMACGMASADVGTALMWTALLHLVLGNAAIGLVEGGLLARIFGRPRLRCIVLMVAANYLSAGAGLILFRGLSTGAELDIYHARLWFWVHVGIAFLLTLVLEWPLVWLCLRGLAGRLKKSLWASILVQSVSYACILAVYVWTSGALLDTDVKGVALGEIECADEVSVYFIAEEDGDVYKMDLREGQREKVYDLNSDALQDRLQVWPASDNGEVWELVASRWLYDQDSSTKKVIFGGLSHGTVPRRGDEPSELHFTQESFAGDVSVLGGMDSGWNWSLWGGLVGENEGTGDSVRLRAEMGPGVSIFRNATQLLSGCVVFQYGRRQVFLLNPETHEIALLARGRGPVAVLADTEKSVGDRRHASEVLEGS